MKKKNEFFMLGLILFMGLSLSSCKKEGCIDSDADNYNSEAKKDDGTCTYSASHVIWYGEAVAEDLTNAGVEVLYYYVDGVYAGSSPGSLYWTGTPECSQSGTITVNKNLGKYTTQAFTYSVLAEDEFEIWSGVLNFNANTCTKFELKF